MTARAFWFAVGTGAGIYTTMKARKLVYRLSPEGVSDQVAALGLGLRTLAADVRDGMTEREDELLTQLGLEPRRAPGGAPPLVGAAPALAVRSTPSASPGSPVRRDIP